MGEMPRDPRKKNSNEEKKKRCYMMGGGVTENVDTRQVWLFYFPFCFFFRIFCNCQSFLFVNLSGLIHKISIPSSLGSEMLLEQHLLV